MTEHERRVRQRLASLNRQLHEKASNKDKSQIIQLRGLHRSLKHKPYWIKYSHDQLKSCPDCRLVSDWHELGSSHQKIKCICHKFSANLGMRSLTSGCINAFSEWSSCRWCPLLLCLLLPPAQLFLPLSQLSFVNTGMSVAGLDNLGNRKLKTFSMSLLEYSEAWKKYRKVSGVNYPAWAAF